MNSRFATGYCFTNLPLRKPFLVQNYNLAFLSSDKLVFFSHFLTHKNYKNIEKTAQIFFNQARTEYCIAEHI